jgi:sterol desaturase/sphingolipid hydroxylase (fatty acid hydroxylase superfamily)
MRTCLRYVYVPFIGCLALLAIRAAGHEAPLWHLAMIVLAGITASFAAEHILPVSVDSNRDQGDERRDIVHTVVNEGLSAACLASLPLLSEAFTVTESWPVGLPFVLQVLGAILVFDLGVTLAHLASHKVGVLWRFHAVHHSVRRLYGLNGLMKHPLHQLIETTAGFSVLLAFGIPRSVAAALAACAAFQLLLQHSNVDYRVGPLERWLALNSGHRLHHRRWPRIGDVNFGLFTLVWDRMLGTYDAPGPAVTSDDLGIDAQPDYPVTYLAQLIQPFRRTAAVSPASAQI